MNTNIVFEELQFELINDTQLGFLFKNIDVTKGYEISIQGLNNVKTRHNDELIEGKHFVFRKTKTNGGMQNKLFWTKRGVIRLGFFITSERAKRFRDWAEELIIDTFDNSLAQQTSQIQPHQTQNQLQNFDLSSYTKQSKEIFELVELINSKSIKNLYFADKLYKSLNIKSPIELLEIDLSNYYLIPTELGKLINSSAIETNKILEAKGFQTKQNGVWKLTELGKEFGIEVSNGSFLQIKWQIKALI